MSNHESTYQPQSRAAKWMDERLPVARMMHAQFVDFPTPRNLNYMWTFGGILMFMLVVMIVSCRVSPFRLLRFSPIARRTEPPA